MANKKKDFRKSFGSGVKIKIREDSYDLREFTMKVDMHFKEFFPDQDAYSKNLQNLDSKTMCQVLWLLLKDKDRKNFKTWEDLADIIPGNVPVKAEIFRAIIAVITKSMPDQKELLNQIDNAKKNFLVDLKKDMDKIKKINKT